MKKTKYPRSCPKCGSRDFEVEYTDDEEVITKECHCERCHAVFNVYYEFTEFEVEE